MLNYSLFKKKCKLSVIVCTYNMKREAPRTINSCLPPYQKKIDNLDYEVIVVDNNSTSPIEIEFIESLPANVKFYSYPNKSQSPVKAINWVIKKYAKGEYLLICIDGARIFSENIISQSINVISQIKNAFVFTMAWHLGPSVQMISVNEGYNQDIEDKLLESIDWYNHPKALFNISSFAGSSANGFFMPIQESNAFCISKKNYYRLGGFNEKFKTPGGGISNHDFFCRCVNDHITQNVCLLDAGTFHQIHGGAATSNTYPSSIFYDEYKSIYGYEYTIPSYQSFYYGTPFEELHSYFNFSLNKIGRIK